MTSERIEFEVWRTGPRDCWALMRDNLTGGRWLGWGDTMLEAPGRAVKAADDPAYEHRFWSLLRVGQSPHAGAGPLPVPPAVARVEGTRND